MVQYSTHINETDKGIDLILAQLNSVHRNLELILYEKTTRSWSNCIISVFSERDTYVCTHPEQHRHWISNPLPIDSPPAQPQTKIHLDHPSSLAELLKIFLATHINKVHTLKCVGCRTWHPGYRICTKFCSQGERSSHGGCYSSRRTI
jgi:hypothetical protein